MCNRGSGFSDCKSTVEFSGADPIAILTTTTIKAKVNTENRTGRNFNEPGESLLKV
jgi:hypothetical protein